MLSSNQKIIHFQKNGSEIRRRLDIMKKMWEEDKLKPEIYVKMIQLTEGWFCVLHEYVCLMYSFGLCKKRESLVVKVICRKKYIYYSQN
jgi:hypothetical protein